VSETVTVGLACTSYVSQTDGIPTYGLRDIVKMSSQPVPRRTVEHMIIFVWSQMCVYQKFLQQFICCIYCS